MKRCLTILSLVAMVCATSCTHKELCDDHREHAHRYHINIIADYRYDWEEHLIEDAIDWEYRWPDDYIPYDSLRPTKPSGLRVVNYNTEGDYNMHNVKADGGVVTLYEGPNNILFYNNDTEYIIFSRTENGTSTRATTRTRTRSEGYTPNRYGEINEELRGAPDMLFANYIEGYIPEKVVEPTPLEVTLQPLVFKYKIRFEFKEGLKYVSQAKGELTGMAASVLLETGETSEETATIPFDNFEITDWGVRSTVMSYGTPGYPNPNYPTRNGKHGLTLWLLLKSNKTVKFEYDVADQLALQPHGGVIIIKDIVITEEQGEAGSGVFDVEVEGWGDYVDVELPL